jgi:membrane-associated protease RseP (regulator of RpoE activity)
LGSGSWPYYKLRTGNSGSFGISPGRVPAGSGRPWVVENLKNALVINVLLAIFNLLPLPPLDGGRIAVGVLPRALAILLARMEPYGMMILIGVLFVLPLLGTQLGIDLNMVWQLMIRSTNIIISLILRMTGNG